MRADRLISLLMLLQSRGRMTARRLAAELEVSERTIYRDIDALSTAGVPVFAERGPGGGCELLDRYRTSLTGMTDSELQALFMLSIPVPLVELGVGQELRAALRKLAAALPAGRHLEAGAAGRRILLDSAGWHEAREAVPRLRAIHQALGENRRLELVLSFPFRPETRIQQRVDPLGLVAKGNSWYLVCAGEGHTRVHRVSLVMDARILDEHFARPPDFELAEFWRGWCARKESNRPSFPVTLRVSPALQPYLDRALGVVLDERPELREPVDDANWLELTVDFESFYAARERLLGLGNAVEIVAPLALRKSVLDFAWQIVARYERPDALPLPAAR